MKYQICNPTLDDGIGSCHFTEVLKYSPEEEIVQKKFWQIVVQLFTNYIKQYKVCRVIIEVNGDICFQVGKIQGQNEDAIGWIEWRVKSTKIERICPFCKNCTSNFKSECPKCGAVAK